MALRRDRFTRVLLVLAWAVLAGPPGAWAETGYLVGSTTFGNYKSGAFGSYEAGGADAVAEYQRNRPSYTGLEWCNEPPTAYNTAWHVYMRWYPSFSPPSGCFLTGFYVTPYYCAAGQWPYWSSPSGGGTCQDFQPTACQYGRRWNAVTCVEPANCPAGLPEEFAGACAAPVAAAKNVGPPPRCCDRPPPPITPDSDTPDSEPKDPPPCCDQTPNPIKPGTGRKYQREVVLRTPTLSLELTYDSTPAALLPVRPYYFGTGWSFNYGMRVWLLATGQAVVLRPDGKFYVFAAPASGNTYGSEADVPDTLTKLLDGTGGLAGWQYRVAAADAVETYSAEGKLSALTQRNGRTTTFAYSTTATPVTTAPRAGLLITATDPFGGSLAFTYDAAARIASATDPAGNTTRFYYDEASSVVLAGQPPGNNLTGIEFPDLQKRIYHYNEQDYTAATNQPNALTGITDEKGIRFALYQYDADGLAVSSEHAGGVERYTVVYRGDGTRTITDPLGVQRTASYQITQRVARTSAFQGAACPACGPAAQSYDGNGYLQSKTDWNGNLTSYVRNDPYGRAELETARTEALGSAEARTITTEWHPDWHLPTRIAEPLRLTTHVYNGDGGLYCGTLADGITPVPGALCSRTVQATLDGNGSQGLNATLTGTPRTWRYTYNANGAVLTLDGPRTDVADLTTFTYYPNDAACPGGNTGCRGQLETRTDALGHRTTINEYDANGQPRSITDPNGLVTILTYDSRLRLRLREAGGELTGYQYDPAGPLEQVTLPDGSYLHYTYDPAHRLTEIRDNLGNKIVYTPDTMGNRLREEVFDAGGTLRQRHERVYNTLNRLEREIGGADPATQITQYPLYDNNGNLKQRINPIGAQTDYDYDALDRLKRITDPQVEETTPRGLTQYGYDGLDQLIAVTDPRNNTTGYTLTGLGNLTEQVSPDTGTTRNPNFDDAGNRRTSIDARGVTATYTYDALNRVTRIDYSDASFTTYTWDQCANGAGRLCATVHATSTVFWSYDGHGRVTRRDETVGSAVLTTQYAYEPATGRLLSLTYPSGTVITYEYHPNGRVRAIRAPGGVTLLDNASYHPFGRASGWTWGNASTYSRTFDLDGRVQSYTLNTTAARTLTLGYDPASRLTLITDSAGANLNQTMGYDKLDRLTHWSGFSTNQGYGYDASGNRLYLTIGANTYAYTTPASSNRLAATAGPAPAKSFGYDGAGNVTGDGLLSFGYDAGGRLASVTGSAVNSTRQYNGLGERTFHAPQPGVNTFFTYDAAGHLLSEVTVNTATGVRHGADYVYLEDAVVGVVPFTVPAPGQSLQSAGVHYVHPDHLDTPRLVTDTLNRARWRWDSDPFGASPPNENPAGLGVFPLRLRFPGQVADRESNTYYNYFRDYSPEIGRYIESDPIGLAGGINTYAYVGNDPIFYSDPTGLDRWGDDPSLNWDRQSPRVPYPSAVGNGPDLHLLVGCLSTCFKEKLTLTATTNGHTKGSHVKGKAVDIKIPSGSPGSQAANKAVCCALSCGAEYVQDEYTNPSPSSTGGHVHVQLVPGAGDATGTGRYPTPNCDCQD